MHEQLAKPRARCDCPPVPRLRALVLLVLAACGGEVVEGTTDDLGASTSESTSSASETTGVSTASITDTTLMVTTMTASTSGDPLTSGPASTSGSTSTSDSATTTESSTTGDSLGSSTGTESFRRVFLTSAVFGAQLGGIEGADAKCQFAADSAGLGGTFRAWISTPTSSAMDNLFQSPDPYVRIDGVEIAANWTDLTDGELAAPLEIDEWGVLQNNSDCGNVWTNTLRDGKAHDEDACTAWTSLQDAASLGRSDVTNYSWTEGCVQDCLKQYHLYCFEQ